MNSETSKTKRAFICLLLKVSGNVNADAGIGTRVPLKKIITMNKEIKAFVSSRCIRRAIRKRLYERGFKVDPMFVEREKLFDAADPIKYIDDDLFGYLAPGEVTSRSGAIKISPLISLRHTEIKVEFAARFPRNDFIPEAEKAFPTPYEVEVAEFTGRLNVIISNRIGKFHEEELTEEVKKRIDNKQGEEYSTVVKVGNEYVLPIEKRKERLRAFLEILLCEGWEFPRGAQSPNIPDYEYAVIALTDKFLPIFGYVDLTEDGCIDEKLLRTMMEQYKDKMEKAFIIDYKRGEIRTLEKGELKNKQALTNEIWGQVVNDIVNYIITR